MYASRTNRSPSSLCAPKHHGRRCQEESKHGFHLEQLGGWGGSVLVDFESARLIADMHPEGIQLDPDYESSPFLSLKALRVTEAPGGKSSLPSFLNTDTVWLEFTLTAAQI